MNDIRMFVSFIFLDTFIRKKNKEADAIITRGERFE